MQKQKKVKQIIYIAGFDDTDTLTPELYTKFFLDLPDTVKKQVSFLNSISEDQFLSRIIASLLTEIPQKIKKYIDASPLKKELNAKITWRIKNSSKCQDIIKKLIEEHNQKPRKYKFKYDPYRVLQESFADQTKIIFGVKMTDNFYDTLMANSTSGKSITDFLQDETFFTHPILDSSRYQYLSVVCSREASLAYIKMIRALINDKHLQYECIDQDSTEKTDIYIKNIESHIENNKDRKIISVNINALYVREVANRLKNQGYTVEIINDKDYLCRTIEFNNDTILAHGILRNTKVQREDFEKFSSTLLSMIKPDYYKTSQAKKYFLQLQLLSNTIDQQQIIVFGKDCHELSDKEIAAMLKTHYRQKVATTLSTLSDKEIAEICRNKYVTTLDKLSDKEIAAMFRNKGFTTLNTLSDKEIAEILKIANICRNKYIATLDKLSDKEITAMFREQYMKEQLSDINKYTDTEIAEMFKNKYRDENQQSHQEQTHATYLKQTQQQEESKSPYPGQ
jgi:hypothetical protein